MDSDITGLDHIGFEEFELKLTNLLRLTEQLKAENMALRASQGALQSSNSDLLEKNEQARTKVSSILARLKKTELTAC